MEDNERNNPEQEVTADQTVPVRKVASSLFGGLAIALLVTWAIGQFRLEWIFLAYWFPVGITLFLGLSNLHLSLFLGYVLYTAIFVCAFIFRKKRAFAVILGIYTLILLLNIGGCVAIQQLENIH